MKGKKTFIAKIAVGFREGYTQKTHTFDEAYAISADYCNKIGLCVTVTPTRFFYTRGAGIPDGWEDGCFVELIAHPRFPQSKYDIMGLALDLAKIFLKEFKQKRISVISSDQTFLVEEGD